MRAAVLVLLLGSFSALAQDAPKARPRVFISGSGTTDLRRGLSAVVSSSSHDQTMELAQDFARACPGSVTVTLKPEGADYTVSMNHEAFQGVFVRNDHVMVSNRDGDVLLTKASHSVMDGVKAACAAISGDWSGR